jgi:hypothetical protein
MILKRSISLSFFFITNLILVFIFSCVGTETKLIIPNNVLNDNKGIKAYDRFIVKPKFDVSGPIPFKSTNIFANKNDHVLFFAHKKNDSGEIEIDRKPPNNLQFFYIKIGDEDPTAYSEYRFYLNAKNSGLLMLAVQGNMSFYPPSGKFKDKSSFIVDLFVVSGENEKNIYNIFNTIKKQNPQSSISLHLDRIGVMSETKFNSATDSVLKQIWFQTILYSVRIKIVDELEKRTNVRPLQSLYKESVKHKARFQSRDIILLVDALSRFSSPEVAETLMDLGNFSDDKHVKIAILKAFQKIKYSKAISMIKIYLTDPDHEVRSQALDTLSSFKNKESMEAIYHSLFDEDRNIRWRAVHALGKIGNPEAIERISLLLTDEDQSVRAMAEMVLAKLGASKDQIEAWKEKSQALSLDDVYQSKVAYKKAVLEKEALLQKLENEKDLKREWENALREKEKKDESQQNLLESLYEKERLLKSKTFQLDETLKKAKLNQTEIEKLNTKAAQLEEKLRKKEKHDIDTLNLKNQLDEILNEKEILEAEAKEIKTRETKLQSDIASLKEIAERARSEAKIAKQELELMRDRESELIGQIDRLKKRLNRGMSPVVVISQPKDGSKSEYSNIMLNVIVVDDKGIEKVQIHINGKPLILRNHRGLRLVKEDIPKKVNIAERLQLNYGINQIKVNAQDIDGMNAEEIINVVREKEHGKIWAVIVGINQYENTRNLKFAVKDAQDFRDYLKDYIGIPEDHMFFLTDKEASKENIQSLLGTQLRRMASRDDTVIIFYAGHGAAETDPINPDGDGFEKYLLPHDAKLNDLYTTAISMNEIKTIFQRIRSERLIFLADTCYSGASGGRTMLASKTRATLSEKFFERISKGKGRVIISACSANEISKEDDRLQHGIFSYYLLEGLKGKSDKDGDGIITVSELFSYLSQKVPEASGQDQHPVRKGETEGELVIGRTK